VKYPTMSESDRALMKFHEMSMSTPIMFRSYDLDKKMMGTKDKAGELEKELRFVENQLQKLTTGFIYYHIQELTLIGPMRKDGKSARPGPAVTVCLAEMNKELAPNADGKFVRGVAFCHAKDTPSKKQGRLHAARKVLRALKDGIAPFNPTDGTIKAMADVLLDMGIMTLFREVDEEGNGHSTIVAGDVGVDPTESEKAKWEIHLEDLNKPKKLNPNHYGNMELITPDKDPKCVGCGQDVPITGLKLIYPLVMECHCVLCGTRWQIHLRKSSVSNIRTDVVPE